MPKNAIPVKKLTDKKQARDVGGQPETFETVLGKTALQPKETKESKVVTQ